MDIGKAFSFPFDDEQWVGSILICGAMLLVPIVGWLAIGGYTLEVARNVAMGSPRPLPRWDNFGEKLRLGFHWFVINFVWALPLSLIATLASCLLIVPAATENEGAMAAGFGLFFCVIGLVVLLALVISPLILAATVRYLQTGSLGAAFKVGEIVAMVRADLGGWVVLWLLSILCSFVAQLGGYVIIGIFFTLPYAQAVFGHMLGQTMQRLGQPAGVSYSPPSMM
jgi:Protein of unknown function (DUF4013)